MSFFKKLFGGGDPAPDTQGASKQVLALMSTELSIREPALNRALQLGDAAALQEVEEAIKRLTGKRQIDFYRPGGMHMGSPQEAYNQVVALARQKKFSQDPAFVQSLIPGVAYMNEQLMRELLTIDPKALAIYQLLGIQMQLKIQVG